MESEELIDVSQEVREESAGRSRQVVGVTTAMFAALLAVVTMLGHRFHTDEVVVQTKSADGWAYFQAKNNRAQMYAADARLAELVGGNGAALAAEWREKAEKEQHDAEEIRHENEGIDRETTSLARRATFFDISEVCLEVAIVLCSITLMTGRAAYWQLSFIAGAAGVLIAASGYLPR